jgi:type I restriction enzyme, S subunit
VRFLDMAEKHIRRYIRAKQKLIKLLNQQKQAIIQQAVTRSLDADVPMKDSGVQWIGEIPEHWEAFALKFAFQSMDYATVFQRFQLIRAAPVY